jgi:hypothetical protein
MGSARDWPSDGALCKMAISKCARTSTAFEGPVEPIEFAESRVFGVENTDSLAGRHRTRSQRDETQATSWLGDDFWIHPSADDDQQEVRHALARQIAWLVYKASRPIQGF